LHIGRLRLFIQLRLIQLLLLIRLRLLSSGD
jgi:hypothetical protein